MRSGVGVEVAGAGLTSYVVLMLGLYGTWLARRSSLMVSAGMDLEKPRPLQVLVGVLTSVTTGFFSIATCRAGGREEAEEGDGVCFMDAQTHWQPRAFVYAAAKWRVKPGCR